MAEISEIVSKEAIAGIKSADEALTAFDKNMQSSIKALNQFTIELKKQGITVKDLVSIQKAQVSQTKVINDAQKEAAKVIRETEKAAKAQADTLAKLTAKEKEHNEALKLEVKTIQDAQRQNKALTVERNKAVTTYGKQSQAVKDLNSKLTQNTEFMRANGTAMDKQRMNIGNYGSALNGVKSAAIGLAGALGITAGLAGALQLAKGIIASTGASADSFAFTMSGLKEQVQFTARAFANFDFTNFIQGLKEANKEGRRYAETLDLIEDLQRANQLQANDIERQILEQRIIAKNKSNEIGVREAAIKEIVRLEELKLIKTQEITKKGIDNQLKNSAFATKQNEADVLDLVKNYDKRAKAVEEGGKLIADIEAKTTKTQIVQGVGGAYQAQYVDTKAREKAYKDLTASQKESIKFANIDKQLTDEKKKALVAAVDADQKATNEMLSGKESLIRLENSLRSELLKTQDEGYGGNIKEVEKQITAQQKLSNRIAELTDKMTELRLANEPIPNSMIRELISSQTALENVKKEVEAIAAGMVAIQSKGIGEIKTTGTGVQLTKRATTGGGAPIGPEAKESIFAPGEASQFAIESAQTTSDTIFQITADRATAEFDLQMSLLEKEKEAKLSAANLTEAQKAKIESDYAKKVSKLKTEQFKKDKAAAIIQATINGVIAVLKAGGLTNPVGIAAAVSAAAQIAVIAAQKVPQFDSGTLSTPSEFIAGERRPEWMIEPSGRVNLVTKPTHFKNMAGATVIGGSETKRMMEQGITPTSDIRPDIQAMKSDIVNAIRNKRELHISAMGTKITEREGNYYKTYFNRKVEWVGRKN
jgi:hypothetical protein